MKILVIGTNTIRHSDSEENIVNSFHWHDVKKINNFGEYERVILICDTLPTPQAEDIHGIAEILSAKNVSRIILHGGDIILLGDPTKLILDWTVDVNGNGRSSNATSMSLTRQLGVAVHREHVPGSGGNFRPFNETPESLAPYLRYARFVERWENVCKTSELGTEYYSKAVQELRLDGSVRNELWVAPLTLLENRFQAWVASAVCFLATKYTNDAWDEQVKVGDEHLGNIVYLPVLYGNYETSILTLLVESWGIEAVSSAPDWVASLVAPGQEDTDAAIQLVRAEIDDAMLRLTQLEAEREQSRQSLRLLYSMHTELEEAVATTLSRLGAIKIEHGPANHADGLFRVDQEGTNRYFALEIKGTGRATFDQKGIRQLNDWVAEAEELVNDRVKGVFIGNSDVTKAPSERTEPFESSFIKAAERRGFATLTSEELYRALAEQVNGNDIAHKFFNLLFDAEGRMDLGSVLGKGQPGAKADK